MVETVFGSTDANTSEVIDPLGVDLPLGPDLYPQLIERLAGNIASCGASS